MARRRRSQPDDVKAPDYLDEIAQAEWDRVLPELEELGLFDPLFTEILGLYCSVFSTATYHEGLCEKYGDDHILEEGTEFAETARTRGRWDRALQGLRGTSPVRGPSASRPPLNVTQHIRAESQSRLPT